MEDELGDFFGEQERRDFFAMIPNLVDDLDLTPYAFRLYVHLCRVVGHGGKCWQSTETLAAACHMSTGSVVKAKRELANMRVGDKSLIYVIAVPGVEPGRAYHTVYVNDIWAANHDRYAKKEKRIDKGSIPGVLVMGAKCIR